MEKTLNPMKLIKTIDYIEKKEVPKNCGVIYKKYEDDYLEINTYHLFAGNGFYFSVPKNEVGIKSYAIMSGRLKGSKDGEFYECGDIIILKHHDENHFFYTEEEVVILVTSYRELAFQENEKRFQLIMDVMEQIQEKDQYTMDHCFGVSDIYREVALEAGWEGDKLINALVAAKYHDIGKVLTPEEILNKPSTLNEEEFHIMQRHVIDCIKFLNGYLNTSVIEIILQHHERIDGSGYPNHLNQTDILDEAKALAVVDTYHAMRSERVYKKAKTKEEALNELHDLTGKLYDAHYVALLVKVLDKNPTW